MSEFGGLRKHENNQHALVVPPKAECDCPSGGGIKPVTYAIRPMEERRKNPEKTTTDRPAFQPQWKGWLPLSLLSLSLSLSLAMLTLPSLTSASSLPQNCWECSTRRRLCHTWLHCSAARSHWGMTSDKSPTSSSRLRHATVTSVSMTS